MSRRLLPANLAATVLAQWRSIAAEPLDGATTEHLREVLLATLGADPALAGDDLAGVVERTAPQFAARRRGDPGLAVLCGEAVVHQLDRHPVDDGALRMAVRATLFLLAEECPGTAVEVRVPPVAAIQCGAGPRHTRGTPPNTVETDPVTWLAVASGRLSWDEAADRGSLTASGPRSDLSAHLPVICRTWRLAVRSREP